MRACECGCGAAVNSRFVPGHNNRGKQTKPRTDFSCAQCGCMFSVRIEPKAKARQFCSSKCRDAHRRENSGAKSPLYLRIETECKVCGDSFFAVPSTIEKGATCSKTCGRITHARSLQGRHPQRIKPDWRKEAKKRDGFKCRICAFSEVIHVHHILPKSKGGKHELGNLITLCPNHHAMVHAGMITPERLAAAIAAPLPSQTEMSLGRIVNFRK